MRCQADEVVDWNGKAIDWIGSPPKLTSAKSAAGHQMHNPLSTPREVLMSATSSIKARQQRTMFVDAPPFNPAQADLPGRTAQYCLQYTRKAWSRWRSSCRATES